MNVSWRLDLPLGLQIGLSTPLPPSTVIRAFPAFRGLVVDDYFPLYVESMILEINDLAVFRNP
jgi:hypothetical protein